MDYDSHAYLVSKATRRIPPHKAHLREADGAVEWEKLRRDYSRVESTVETDDLSTDEWIEHLIRGSNNQRFQYCLNSDGHLSYVRAIQGHAGKQ